MKVSNNIKVSVVIISYNYGKFLKKVLEACRQQTLREFEIIAINNGSKDDTEEIFFDFKKNHPEMIVRYFKIDVNNGLVPARNLGLKEAAGEFIMFNDADDYMSPNCLEKLVTKAERDNLDRVIGGYRNYTEDGKMYKKIIYPAYTSKWLLNSLQANIFRKKLFLDNDLWFPEMYFDDYGISMKFNLYTNAIGYVEEIVYYRMMSINSATNKMMKSDLENPIHYMTEIYKLGIMLNNSKKLDKTEKALVTYEIIKMYYGVVLLFSKMLYQSGQKELLEPQYIRQRETIKKYYPDYLENPCITLFRKNSNRFFGRMLMFFFSKLEKLNLFVPALKLYCKLSQFIVFNA